MSATFTQQAYQPHRAAPSGSISPAVCRCCTLNVDNFQWWRRDERPRRRGPGRCAPERGARGRDMSEPPGPGGPQCPPPPRSPRQPRMGPAPFASFEDLSDEVRPKVCTVPLLCFYCILYFWVLKGRFEGGKVAAIFLSPRDFWVFDWFFCRSNCFFLCTDCLCDFLD